MIEHIVQLLKSIGFTDQEVSDLFTIIYNSIEQSKDPEQQVSNTLNYKFIEAFNLINEVFGGDWYNLIKTNTNEFKSKII
jgi:hypothetical protein